MIGHGNGFALMSVTGGKSPYRSADFQPHHLPSTEEEHSKKAFSLASLRAFPEMRSITFVFAINYHISGVD